MLRICPDSIPGQGTKIPQAMRSSGCPLPPKKEPLQGSLRLLNEITARSPEQGRSCNTDQGVIEGGDKDAGGEK